MRARRSEGRHVGGGLVAAAVVASCVAPGAVDEARPAPSAEVAVAGDVISGIDRAFPGLVASRGADVVELGDAFAPRCEGVCPAEVAVAAVADGESRVTDPRSGVGARFRLEGADAVSGVLDLDRVVFPAALRGADLVHRIGPSGTEDFVRFSERPAREELRYELRPERARALRLVASTLELLDARGVPGVRVAPPWLVDAGGRKIAATLEVEGCAVDRDPRAPWTRPVVELGAATCEVVVSWSGRGARYPLVVDPAWTSAGNMIDARTHHSATLLPDVGVLLAGGFDPDGAPLATAEIGCPPEICGFPSYAATGDLPIARGAHGDAALDAERVIVVGGRNARDGGAALATVAIYDHGTGTFSAAPSMTRARDGHTTTLLEGSGDVLVTGGDGLSPSTAERFDASGGAWGGLVTMTTRRTSHAAEALSAEGLVLVVGGIGPGGFPLQTAEIFDAATSTFTAVADDMTAPRVFATATRLDDGRVLITGGTNGASVYYSTADIFQPDDRGGGAFQQQPVVMERPRAFHRATKLLGSPGVSGRVLLTGGFDGEDVLRASEVFDADAVAFELASTMIAPRDFHTATRLGSGQVLVAGGGFDLVATDEDTARSTELLLRSNGEPCAAAAECEGGFCPGAPDGVCCDQACEETCETCLTGTCEVVPDETEVRPICTDAVEILLVCVDGQVSAGAIDPCEAYACDGEGVRCGTSCETDAECSAAGWCDAPVCLPKKEVGEPCEEGRECQLGFCADGVCCNAACEGRCQACDLAGAVGVCQQNEGPPREGRAPCEGAGGPCEGVCGTDPDECDFPPATCSPGDCQGGQLSIGRCHVEAPGECATVTEACGAFACNAAGDACVSICQSATECADGHACRDGQCVLVQQPECEGPSLVVSPDGGTEECAPYRCVSGACRDRCVSVDDCTEGFVCDEAGACVEPPDDPPPPDGCRAASGDAPAPLGGLVTLALAALAVRRRGGRS